MRLKNMGLTIMPTTEISTKQRLETIKKEVSMYALPPGPPAPAKTKKAKKRRKVILDDDHSDSDDSRDEDFVPGGGGSSAAKKKKKRAAVKTESGVTITPTSDPPLVQSASKGGPLPKIGFKCRACLIAYSTRELMQKCMAGHRNHINMDEEVTCPKCEEKIPSR